MGYPSGYYLIKSGAEGMGKNAEKTFHGRLPTFLLLNTTHITFRVSHYRVCLSLKVNSK